MNPGDPTGTFCDCRLPDRKLENGNLYCAECGRQVISTFSCDIAYSRSPAASRASA
jgi:hypothetical protein